MSAPDATVVGAIQADARDFEDVRVGTVSAVELPAAPGAAGPQLLSSLAQVAPVADARMVDVQWQPAGRAGTTGVRAEAVVTRWKPVRKRGRGRVHQDVRLLSAEGQLVEHAVVAWDVPAGTEVRDDEAASRVAWDVGTVAWGRHLAAGLADNERFASAVQTFDGSVAIRAGEEQVELRIYRGSVIEVARKSLDGPTFTVTGSERAWIDLLSSPKNDFVNRTQRNEFRSSGNNYQYLRIFKAIMLMVDEAQLAAAKEKPSA